MVKKHFLKKCEARCHYHLENRLRLEIYAKNSTKEENKNIQGLLNIELLNP